jgi:hypothetical protein
MLRRAIVTAEGEVKLRGATLAAAARRGEAAEGALPPGGGVR